MAARPSFYGDGPVGRWSLRYSVCQMRVSILTLLFASLALSQGNNFQTAPVTIPLWDGSAPGALGTEDRDRPTLTIFLPGRDAVQTGVIVCPGGGYGALADNHEGRQVANWLNSMGIAAFVLKYRLGPRYHHPVELGCATGHPHGARAGERVRHRSRSHRNHGFFRRRSSGFHCRHPFRCGQSERHGLAIDRQSSRPDFLILGYPVISFTTPYTHKGSLKNLLGDNPDPKLVESLSSELQVTAQTPPTFLFHTNEDTGVPAENSVLFYLALRKNNVPAEIHVFEKGPHGVGLAMRDPALSIWPDTADNWLRGSGLLEK